MTLLGKQLMADPVAGVVEAADPEPLDELADAAVLRGRRLGRRRYEVVDDDHHPLRVEDLLDPGVDEVAEDVGCEDVVRQGQVDAGDDELARRHLLPAGGPGENLLGKRLPHRYIAGLARLRPPQT